MCKLIKKGVTLIELLIVVAIIGIVISVIGPFFISNYKASNYVKDELALQDEGEKAINFITEKCMDGSKIYIINGQRVEEITNMNSIVIKNIVIQTIEKKAIFLKIQDGKFYYGEGEIDDEVEKKANKEICSDIKKLTIKQIPKTFSYEKCEGIRIDIELELNKIEKKFISEIYFRNR